MRILVWVDDSPWTCRALQFVCRRLVSDDELVLLVVCPRAAEGYLECGRMQLEKAVWACAGTLMETPPRLRLAVGDPHILVPLVAAEERADLVVAGVLGGSERLCEPSLDDTGWIAHTGGERTLLVGSPRGIELMAGEEGLLVTPWREVLPVSHLRPITTPCEVTASATDEGSYARGGPFNGRRHVHR
jgi:hypothetical protein